MYSIYQKFSNLKHKRSCIAVFLVLMACTDGGERAALAVNPVGKISPPQRAALKGGGVLARTGPGKNYPQARIYLREQPVSVVAFFEHYRQIQDLWGFTAWVHKNSLTSHQLALTAKEAMLRKGPNQEQIAKLAPGVTLFVKEEKGEGIEVEVFMVPYQGGWMNALESRSTMAVSKMKGWIEKEALKV